MAKNHYLGQSFLLIVPATGVSQEKGAQCTPIETVQARHHLGAATQMAGPHSNIPSICAHGISYAQKSLIWPKCSAYSSGHRRNVHTYGNSAS